MNYTFVDNQMPVDKQYQMIFKRKSIRKYDFVPFEEETLEHISAFMDELNSIDENINIDMKIVTHNVVSSLLPIKAPYYILFFSENKDGYLTNAGFMLQQLDLFLSGNGIGSCWVGLAKPKKEITRKSELAYVIALSFGKADEKLHRASKEEFKRKNIKEIREGCERDQLIEAARFAPSATNSQPWFFRVVDNKIHAYCVKSNFIKAIFYEKINKIDMGIAIYHLCIAASHFGYRVEITFEEKAAENSPDGYYYIASLVVDNSN